MFKIDEENKVVLVEKMDQPLLRSRPWDEVWHKGFMPQFSDAELQKIAAELADERSLRLSKEIIRGCFFCVAAAAHKAVNKNTATWAFFDWLDTMPMGESFAMLRGLVADEIAKRKADAEAKEVNRGPEESAAGSGVPEGPRPG